MVGEPDAVTEKCALRERAGRVDGDHACGRAEGTNVREQRGDQARLADARRPRDADRVGLPGGRIEVAHELVRQRIGVLDQRDRSRERAAIAGAHAVHERLARPLPPSGHGQTLRRQLTTETTSTSGSGSSDGCSGTRRVSTLATSAARAAIIAAPPYSQRAPKRSVSGPATIMPMPISANVELMSTVKARPRSRSATPRWTSSEL